MHRQRSSPRDDLASWKQLHNVQIRGPERKLCRKYLYLGATLLYPITITFAWMVYSRLNIIRVTTRSITRSKRRKSLLFLSKQSGERGFRCVTLDELAQDRSGSGSWPDKSCGRTWSHSDRTGIKRSACDSEIGRAWKLTPHRKSRRPFAEWSAGIRLLTRL